MTRKIDRQSMGAIAFAPWIYNDVEQYHPIIAKYEYEVDVDEAWQYAEEQYEHNGPEEEFCIDCDDSGGICCRCHNEKLNWMMEVCHSHEMWQMEEMEYK